MSKQVNASIHYVVSGDGESADVTESFTIAASPYTVQNVTVTPGQQTTVTRAPGAKLIIVVPPTTSTSEKFWTDGNDFGEGGRLGTNQPCMVGNSTGGTSTFTIGMDEDGSAETVRVVQL